PGRADPGRPAPPRGQRARRVGARQDRPVPPHAPSSQALPVAERAGQVVLGDQACRPLTVLAGRAPFEHPALVIPGRASLAAQPDKTGPGSRRVHRPSPRYAWRTFGSSSISGPVPVALTLPSSSTTPRSAIC